MTLVFAIAPMLFLATTATDSHAKIGLGVHYHASLGEIKDDSDFDSDSIGFLGALAFGPALLNFEVNVEYLPNAWGDYDLVQPAAYAFIGKYIYGGLGIGVSHLNGEWSEDPYFDIRAGVKLLVFDMFASYRFVDFDDLGDMGDDLDSLTFGAMLKF